MRSNYEVNCSLFWGDYRGSSNRRSRIFCNILNQLRLVKFIWR